MGFDHDDNVAAPPSLVWVLSQRPFALSCHKLEPRAVNTSPGICFMPETTRKPQLGDSRQAVRQVICSSDIRVYKMRSEDSTELRKRV